MRLLLQVLTIGIFAFTAHSAPSWYTNHSLEFQSYEIFGYGEGATRDEAFNSAASMISEQIMVSISSSSEFRSSTNGQYSQKKEIKSHTSNILRGLQLVKYEVDDDKHYIAVKFINLPFVSQVAIRQKEKACEKVDNNTYINRTSLAMEFKSRLGCVPHISWFKTSGVWYAEIASETYIVPNSDFIKLFSDGGSEKVVVRASRNLLKPKDVYSFLINIKDGTDGYFSLFQVNQTGGVSTLISNKKLNGITELIYPDLEKYDGLEAMLPEGQNSDKDMAFAVVCPERIDCGLFEEMSTNTNISGKGFTNLIRQTDKCEIHTIVTEVRR